MKSRVTLIKNMHFNGELDGHLIPIDADQSVGGENKGPRPKGLLLTALAGCTAMDVISILRKMRAEPEEFYVETEGPLTEEHPKVFKSITIRYYLKGGNVTKEKAERAIHLSLENYCGVTAMLEKACPINYELIIE
ncbi:MAG TPA: OsmC family protein [Spirochaetota bacterium]|nr:OsmC family protein [Spirochaetota bacterium]HPP03918.1 OsmC family protein [Spirochaetota bacterium]